MTGKWRYNQLESFDTESNQTKELVENDKYDQIGIISETKQLFQSMQFFKTTFINNLSSSLSVCLMSFPVAVSLTLSMNDRLGKNELKPSLGVVTLIIGFLFSFFITGGNCIFKSFTGILHWLMLLGAQYPILSDALARFGKASLPAISIGCCFITLLFVSTNWIRIIRYIPTNLLEGLRFGTGLYMFFGDSYSLLHIKNGVEKLNILEMGKSVISNFAQIDFTEVMLAYLLMVCLLILHKRNPHYPWFFIFGIFGAIYGNLQTIFELDLLPLLKDNYKMNHSFKNMISCDYTLIFKGARDLLHPRMIFYTLGVEMVILMEGLLTIKISESFYKKKVNIMKEYTSLGLINGVSALLGLLPVGFPIARNIVGFHSGASHRLFHLLNFLLISLLFFFLLQFFASTPTSVLKSLNLATALILTSPANVTSFFTSSIFSGLLCLGVGLGMCFFEVVKVVAIALVIAATVYWSKGLSYNPPHSSPNQQDRNTEVVLVNAPGMWRYTVAEVAGQGKVVIRFEEEWFGNEIVYIQNWEEVVTELETTKNAVVFLEGIPEHILLNNPFIKNQSWIYKHIENLPLGLDLLAGQ